MTSARRTLLPIALVALLSALSACPSTPSRVPPVSPPPGLFNAAANPTLVTPVPDVVRAVTVLVPRAGGVVTATGADGATFTLTVPAEALAEDTLITLTPLSSIGGLPLDALVAGVQLAPDGLELGAFATLAVVPASSLAVERQVYFGYSTFEGAQELFLTPPEPGAAVRMKLLHFSGYGLGDGSSAQAGQQANRQVHDARGRLLQQLALAQAAARRQHLLDPNAPAAELSDTPFRDYDAQVLQPRIALGAPTCAFGKGTLNELFFVQRLALLFGVDFTFDDGEPALFEAIAATCIAEAMCRRGELLGLLRLSALLGLEGSPAQQSIEAELTRCDGGWKGTLRWTVTGSSTIDRPGPGTTYRQTRTREGSGTMTFAAAPGAVSPLGGGIPVESIQATDRFTEETISTNTDAQCVYTQRERSTESGTATRARTDGTAYAFLLIQGTTYSLQVSGLEVPTTRVETQENLERCAPATTDSPKGSNTFTNQDSLAVIVTESLGGPIVGTPPRQLKGATTFKQGADPELTITLEWDFAQP